MISKKLSALGALDRFATTARADLRFAIILGTAETEIAEKFARASEHYRDNPVALHLRAMNMVFEGLRKKGSMIIVPSSAVETMGLGALGGLTAFGQTVVTDEVKAEIEAEVRAGAEVVEPSGGKTAGDPGSRDS